MILLLRPETACRIYWMREIAQRADSAIGASGEAARRWSSALILACVGVSRCTREFPSAMQALRTSPRHFVRLIALPRKAARYSSSLNEASHSRLRQVE